MNFIPRTFLPLRRTLLATTFLGTLAVSSHAQMVVTSFENPPFVSGTAVSNTSGGITGWSSSTTNANGQNSPLSGYAYEGTQALRVNNNATAYFTQGYYTTVGTPDYIYNLGADSASFHFSANNTLTFSGSATIATFNVIYSDTASTVAADNYRIGVSLRYGETASDPLTLLFFNTGSTNALVNSTTVLSLAPADIDLGANAWNEISFTLNHLTSQVDVGFNGDSLGSVDLNATNFNADSHISGFRFQSSNSAAGGTMYYDYVTVVPEPTTALLALGGLGFVVLRRKRVA